MVEYVSWDSKQISGDPKYRAMRCRLPTVIQRLGLSVLTYEHVVRRIGNAQYAPRNFATSKRDPAFGVDALDGCHIGQDAVAAMLDDLELQQRNIVSGCAGRASNDLAFHAAAVEIIPIGAGVVPPYGHSV